LFYLYVLRSIPSGRHYIGITSDVERLLEEHNSKTGRWTSRFQPWELVIAEGYPDRRSAAQRERFLKSREGVRARYELYSRLG
jgi:putative endonuclease